MESIIKRIKLFKNEKGFWRTAAIKSQLTYRTEEVERYRDYKGENRIIRESRLILIY